MKLMHVLHVVSEHRNEGDAVCLSIAADTPEPPINCGLIDCKYCPLNKSWFVNQLAHTIQSAELSV